MRQSTIILLLVAFVTKAYCAPQLISFKDGKIGVNFAGYHASAGLGGLLGDGASGGLFAEADTPFGQSARAGLGGSVDGNGGSAGRLYAGATAGGKVKASAGLGGGVLAEETAGGGFASAQAGDRHASAGLGGEATAEGSSGFTFSKSKSFGISGGHVKEVAFVPKPVQPVEIHKEVELKVDSANEVQPLPLIPVKAHTESRVGADFNVKAEAPATVLVKEVFVEPPPPKVIEKTVYHRRFKPHHRHHFRKTAYLGGYIGSDGSLEHPPPPPPPPAPVVYKTKVIQPVIQKRVDVGVESDGHVDAAGYGNIGGTGGGEISYKKQVTFQRNPTFFADIFNIPISTLKAVGNFLGNAAESTSVSVQKTASVQAENDESWKHAPLSSSSSSGASSDTHISVQTPNASSFIDDIIAIPVNTLGAVNKFLENNVSGRKTVQVAEDGETSRLRLGPHARRRANKQVIVVEESPDTPEPRPLE